MSPQQSASPSASSRSASPIALKTGESQGSDGYIALGSIRLVQIFQGNDHGAWNMVGMDGLAPWPSRHLESAIQKDWIRTDLRHHSTHHHHAALRVYAAPENLKRRTQTSVKDFRKLLKGLINFIDISPRTWTATHDVESTLLTYRSSQTAHQESLFYIFNTLTSPQPSLDNLASMPYAQQAMMDVLQDDVAGLRSALYPYQKRSAAAMIEKESRPSMTLDPRKPPFIDLQGHRFYFDIIDGVLLLEPYLYSEPQGGILAETMGYGKTLICISLILATRGQYPKVPEARLILSDDCPNLRTPTLVELAAKTLKRSGTPWKAQLADLEKLGYHFDDCKQALDKWEAEYAEPIFHPVTPDRRASHRESYSIRRLSYSTLVIVPPNLLIQWQHEIQKHTEQGALDVLVIDSNTKSIPDYKILMQHDVVLMTKARFEQEYRDDDLNQGRRATGSERFRSQLAEIRWLRVICDEGHGFAGASYRTNAMAMLDKLSIERRWVVSGTPSTSLHGVEVNLATDETRGKTTISRKASIETALQGRKSQDANHDEVKDMERLRVMVVKFLRLQPWANQKGADFADWRKYLAPFDASGNRRFSPGLRTVLQSLIIRHRIEDIDIDLQLPTLHNKTVYLEPSYYDKLSMNLFRLVLTSNAVTSERVDEDYMFHPKNRKSLDELINNLRHSSFHWVGFSKHDVAETIRVSNAYLDSNIDKVSDSDGYLLTEAIMHGQRALDDPGWCAFSFLHEIGVYVSDFPEHAAQAWSLHGEESSPLLLGTVQAREAQQFILQNLDSYDPAAGLTGAGMRAMNAARQRGREEQAFREKNSANSSGKVQPAGSGEQPKVKSQSTFSSSSPSSPVRGPKSASSVGGPGNNLKRSFTDPMAPLPAVLAPTKIIGFTSAKLSYLCSQILCLQDSEKIIIFYDSNNIAFWIAEALELLSVKFLIYANTLSVTRRAAYLATFNHSDAIRVLLMDLKQASHGLHVACASRIFIVSPIWQPSIESQAIKRAHRIGQTRPVFVETLVLKGSLEEKILHRRRQMSNAEHVKAEKSLLDDRTMNQIIRDEGFLKINQLDKQTLTGSKMDVPVPLFERRGDGMEQLGDSEAILDYDGGGGVVAGGTGSLLGEDDRSPPLHAERDIHVSKRAKKMEPVRTTGFSIPFGIDSPQGPDSRSSTPSNHGDQRVQFVKQKKSVTIDMSVPPSIGTV
ncbi:hypothetical protein PV10_01824 [Exophiala mesophila]|uniref:Helicase C-terminal domain-containing protein n=1 Tax=Exophiala mesophila TaxID=212818 RepID=A0A0D1ZVW1_EXOME|nr:uncharacterized protein PV10_01824 [Exophiala mesophila]KIV98144.1 hypothetical protein PV10_01824 [Exophiala mesophila]